MSKCEVHFNGHITVFKAENDIELMEQVIAACEEEKEGMKLLWFVNAVDGQCCKNCGDNMVVNPMNLLCFNCDCDVKTNG